MGTEGLTLLGTSYYDSASKADIGTPVSSVENPTGPDLKCENEIKLPFSLFNGIFQIKMLGLWKPKV